MWGIRFCLCRNALKVFHPTVIRAPNPVLKTFSTIVNCASRQLLRKYDLPKGFNLVKKRLFKSDTTCTNSLAVTETTVGMSPRRKIGIWLIFTSFTVYATIVVGGYTRLTEAGLSMVTWNFTFEKFPQTNEDWEREFKRYQQFPEYQLLRKDMTVKEFRSIFETEYFHRFLGRTVGIFFVVPALGFWLRGWFLPKMKKRVIAFTALILSQGLLGWFMVKSGLEDRFHKESDVPRVSQYRLAAHLGLALTLYTGLLWTALEVLSPPVKPAEVTAGLSRLRKLVHSSKGLVFLTALSGALVAGLDAGLIYNSFPKMGDKWIPDDILGLSPVHINFTENPTTVQFNHRILGITTFSAIMATWLLSRKQKLPRRARVAINSLALAGLIQGTLGISTLVHHVPVEQAVMHQSMAVMLLSMAIWASHELKLMKLVSKFK